MHEIEYPGGAFCGEPGTIWRNDTSKIMYQLSCRIHDACARCWQYARAVGVWWPVPFASGCLCRNVAIVPGEASKPFVDFLALMRTWSQEHQALAMGAENWRLIASGRVAWTDVVTRSRVRPFEEVAHRARLTVEELVGLGIESKKAEAAIAHMQTPEALTARAKAREAFGRLRELGLSDEEIHENLAAKIAGRIVRPSLRNEG